MDLFRCDALSCKLTRRACIARQESEFTVRGTGEVRRPHSMEMCDPKRCSQGASVREELQAAGLLKDLVEDVRRRARQFRYQPRKKAAPAPRALAPPPISAPAPVAAVVHEVHQQEKEERMEAQKKKCAKCDRPAVTKAGLCRPCYQKDWREKVMAPVATAEDKKAKNDSPPENVDVAEYFAALSNDDLATHIAAALTERSKRLAGLVALRDVIPTAA